MGKFACKCRQIISDSEVPCPWLGELRWETEIETLSNQTENVLKDCLRAFEKGNIRDWVKNYFGERYIVEPLKIWEIIDDIYLKIRSEKGRCVLKCIECERIYIQKSFHSNKWTCYKKD